MTPKNNTFIGKNCKNCNTALGLLGDNIEIIENAKQYLIYAEKQ